jgi:hypothetical protein
VTAKRIDLGQLIGLAVIVLGILMVFGWGWAVMAAGIAVFAVFVVKELEAKAETKQE